jgi:hypothetical protein
MGYYNKKPSFHDIRERRNALKGLLSHLEQANELEKRAAAMGVPPDANFASRRQAIAAKIQKGFVALYDTIEEVADQELGKG